MILNTRLELAQTMSLTHGQSVDFCCADRVDSWGTKSRPILVPTPDHTSHTDCPPVRSVRTPQELILEKQ